MTEKSKACGWLYPLLPCLYTPSPEELLSKQRSEEIDRQLRIERRNYRRIFRLLLLGAGESGKSTIIKQMQIIHGEKKFSESVRQERRTDIRNNLLDAIVSIINAMSTLSPPVRLEHSENQSRIDWILKNASTVQYEFPQEFYDHVEILWQDKGVQATYQRSNEYQLIDNAQYFLDKISEIRKDDYLPTEQDILRCRILTNGIHNIVFNINNVSFHMVDVGGQRGERRKWILCFNDITGIIFVASTSAYDSVLREAPTQNRLRESLDIFKVVWNNRFLRTVPVILFLNKQDIFRRKIIAGRSKIEDYFSEYKTYKTPANVKETGEHPEVIRGKFFIKSLFKDICKESDSLTNSFNHCCFPHFTCAVDTENIKRIFDDCRDSIQRQQLTASNLM